MKGTDSRSAFFAREAGEYLESLATLVGGSGVPPGEEFVRLARAVRGAAMLAGPAGFTRAAGQLEQVAKRIRDGGLTWERSAETVRSAVAGLRGLLSRAAGWDTGQEAAADNLAEQLTEFAKEAVGLPTPSAAQPAEARVGLGEFVSREAAALEAALATAAAAAAQGSSTFAASLRPIRLAMRSLRGLAGLADFAPLPDLLDALDAAADELATTPGIPETTSPLLAAAGAAVGRIARGAAEAGAPPDTVPETEAFADLLFRTLVRPPGVVPIESLGADGAGGAPPPSWPLADPVQLAAIGARLRQAAGQLRADPHPPATRLQQFVLLTAIRNAPGGLGHRPAGYLLASLARAIEQEGAAVDVAGFAGVLDRAGDLLSRTPPGSAGFHEACQALAADLSPPRSGPAVAPEVPSPRPEPGESFPAAGVFEGDVVPIESLLGPREPVVPIQSLLAASEEVVPIEALLESSGVVPIESLLEPDGGVVPIEALLEPDGRAVPIETLLEPDGGVVPIETLLVAAAARVGPFAPALAGRSMLERSLSTYSSLVRSGAAVPPFEALTQVAGPALKSTWSRPAAIEIEADLDAIPIEDLVYHGQAALDRAEEVRRDLEAALRFASSEIDRLEPLVRELLDLVPLALVDKP